MRQLKHELLFWKETFITLTINYKMIINIDNIKMMKPNITIRNFSI
jgi:hypothetical protein